VRTNQKTQTGRLGGAFLAGTLALLLVVGVSLLFSRLQAMAQPSAEVTALTIEKQANTQYAAPGDRLTYTIRIQHDEPPVTLWMTDTLPEELTYVDPSWQLYGPGTVNASDGMITWNASTLGYGASAVITFSAEVSSETTVAQIVNTAELTGTGELLTASATTNILSGQPPNSQIRSPDMDAIITQKDPLTISGIAWDEGIVPPYLLDDPVLSLQRVSDRIYYVTWTDVVSAEQYILQEATKPDFSDKMSTVVDAPTTNQLITKDIGDDGTYYYRVQAFRLDLEPSRWSNVESVVVPWTAGSAGLSTSDLSANLAANGPITVQVSMAGGEWHNAVVTSTDWSGWERSYEWDLPEADDVQYTIQTRASGPEGVFGPTDTITVTLRNENTIVYFPLIFKRWPPIPFPPTLNDIDNSDKDDEYTVRWSYDDGDPNVPDPTSYTLQEAKDAPTNFVDVYNGSNTSKDFTDKVGGTYYYRVRGHNTWGPGEWSTIKSVETPASYYYEFNGAGTNNWPIRRTSLYKGIPDRTWTLEKDGSMYILMDDRWDFTIASPFEEAPSPPYTIKTKVKIHDPANLVAYGIVFGGNGGSPCPAYREDGCFEHYYRLLVIWGGGLKAGFKRIDEHEPDKGHGQGKELIDYKQVVGHSGGDKWHTWEIRVETDGIDIYFDGSFFGSTGDTTYIDEPYFGILAATDEYKPGIGRFDYYYVEPN